MPRSARNEVEPGISHVFARGNNRQAIFVDDLDRRRYLGLVARVVGACGWRCLSYCLMPNHVHLLIETRTPNLGEGMRWTQGRYAQAFNRRHGRSGHLFQGRYGAVRISGDAQLGAAIRYIARNPVEASLCSRPQDWPWSSHPRVLSGDPPPWLDTARLLEYVASWGGNARERYVDLVATD